MTVPGDALAALQTRAYTKLLVLAAIIGVPIAAAAFFFLKLIELLQEWLFTDLPNGLGFDNAPVWWPLPLLAMAGIIVSATIMYLPGTGGHSPADGFKAGGATMPIELPGIALAALATLAFGAVLGPEAPLIAVGGGLAVLAVRLAQRDVPAQTLAVVSAAGSFAAISSLFGSPLPAAFLLMEASGLGGATMTLVLLPGLLAAGIGTLTIVGLDSWTGFGTFSLAIPNLPSVGQPTIAEFGYAIAIGVAAAVFGTGIRRLSLVLRTRIQRHLILLTMVAGIVVALLAIVYDEWTGKSSSDVLFSGQTGLGPLISRSASYSVGALVLLLACKGLAYGVSLSSFRGGPVFPAMFIGATGGIALSHLPGLPMVAGAAMGIGAMSAVMLKLPLSSVLLATLLLAADGLIVMPLVIVSVVVAYVVSTRFGLTAAARPAQEISLAAEPASVSSEASAPA
jgi:H+/Cl- antiporter ClcA